MTISNTHKAINGYAAPIEADLLADSLHHDEMLDLWWLFTTAQLVELLTPAQRHELQEFILSKLPRLSGSRRILRSRFINGEPLTLKEKLYNWRLAHTCERFNGNYGGRNGSTPFEKLIRQIRKNHTPPTLRLLGKFKKATYGKKPQSSLNAMWREILEIARLAAHLPDWQQRFTVVYRDGLSFQLHTLPGSTKHPYPEWDNLPLQIKLALGIASEMRCTGEKFYCPWTLDYDLKRAAMTPARLLDLVRKPLSRILNYGPLIACERVDGIGSHTHGFYFGSPTNELNSALKAFGGECSLSDDKQLDTPEYWGFEYAVGWLRYMFKNAGKGTKVNPPDYLINAGRILYEKEIMPFVRSILAGTRAVKTKSKKTTKANE